MSDGHTASGRGLFDLAGRTAVVTGASSGLGMRFAQVLAEAGAKVYAAARRANRLEALAVDQPGIQAVACDVADADQRARLIGQAGCVDVLVNTAGIGGETNIEDEPAEEFARVLNVNLVAAFDLCRLVGATAPESGVSIINVASILGIVAGYPLGGAAYSASKGGIIALTRDVAAQWGHRNIRANALAPGWFRTEMTAELFADERASKFVARNTMLGRAGEGTELDGALLFLASAASSYMTGQVLVVDGGWTAR